MTDLDVIADRFRAQSSTLESRAPLYAVLCAAIADRPDIVGLLLAAPEQQRLPVLLLAAVHDQVLQDPTCPLADWYATVREHPRVDGAAEAFVRHCTVHADAIRHTVATRTTQTNEVGRCALFVPPLGLIAEEVGELALVDVGTSAGLNLQLDRFEYHYEPGGDVGGPSPVSIHTGTRGAVPIPDALPTVAARIGIDRSPIDVEDDEQARWLEACVWPDQADRFHRLEGAIALARRHPSDIRTGDAVDDLAATVGDAARSGHPVVLNSWVLSYLPAERRHAYVAELDRLGARRDLSWIYAESPAQAEGLPFPVRLAGAHITVLMLVRWRRGQREVRHLGVAHPHGYWLHGDDAQVQS